MKVICIDSQMSELAKRVGIKPLEFLKCYTVVLEVQQPKGLGYLLGEIDNSHITVVDHGNKVNEPVTYLASRFIPIEEETIEQKSYDQRNQMVR